MNFKAWISSIEPNSDGEKAAMDAAKRNELLLAAQNQSMIVSFEDANGVYWVYGMDKGVYTSSATAATGQTFADRNGYTVVLTSQEVNPAFTLDAAVIVA